MPAPGTAPDTGSPPAWPREQSQLAGRQSSRAAPHTLEGLQGGAPDVEAHPAPTPPKWPGSLATSCWPSWTALGPCPCFPWFVCLFPFFALLRALPLSAGRRERTRVGAGEGQVGIPWCDAANERTCSADSRGPCTGPFLGRRVMKGCGRRRGPVSPSGPGLGQVTGRAPASCRGGRGVEARGLGRPPCPGGTRGSCCEGARASGPWAFGPLSRPLRSKVGFGPGGPGALEAALGPWCCAWRPGQASPKTPSRSPTPTPRRPPPPPLTPTLPPPALGTQLRGPCWRPLRRAQRRCSGRLIHGMCSLVTPCQGGPRPSRSRRPRTGGKGPGQGGRSPSPGPRNAIGSSFRASVPGSPGSWQRLVARAPSDPGRTCPAGEGSRGRGPGVQRSEVLAHSAFLGQLPQEALSVSWATRRNGPGFHSPGSPWPGNQG